MTDVDSVDAHKSTVVSLLLSPGKTPWLLRLVSVDHGMIADYDDLGWCLMLENDGQMLVK